MPSLVAPSQLYHFLHTARPIIQAYIVAGSHLAVAHSWAVVATKQVTHSHAVVHVLRYGRSMVTLDEGGKALIYTAESEGGMVSLNGTQSRVVRITEKLDFVRMLGGNLWTAARAESQNGVGDAVTRLPIICMTCSRLQGVRASLSCRL